MWPSVDKWAKQILVKNVSGFYLPPVLRWNIINFGLIWYKQNKKNLWKVLTKELIQTIFLKTKQNKENTISLTWESQIKTLTTVVGLLNGPYNKNTEKAPLHKHSIHLGGKKQRTTLQETFL